jgi:hypothetical protein
MAIVTGMCALNFTYSVLTTLCFKACVAKWGVEGADPLGSKVAIAFFCQFLPPGS